VVNFVTRCKEDTVCEKLWRVCGDIWCMSAVVDDVLCRIQMT